MGLDYLKRILNAKVYDVAIESPLELADNLSRRLGTSVYLKREDLQPVFSFKLRGAYNKMAHLTELQRQKGVIAASAGNHAQGVAVGAQRLKVKATIVMPLTTPQVKIEAVRHFGGEWVDIILHGESYSDAAEHAFMLEKQAGLTFVHPFDDPDVIAGQGTIGMEILRQHTNPIEAVFVAIGGGGLAAGVASYIKEVRPETRVIGVQTFDSDAMHRSLKAGHRVQMSEVGLFSDGTAVKYVGKETFRLCQQYLDDVILVNTDEVCAAIKDVFQDTRSILEPAGALAVAGLKQYVQSTGQTGSALVAVACGANMNFDRLRFVAERAEVGEQREAIFAITIPEERGSFRRFCETLGPRNVTEFNYRISQEKEAHLFVGIQIRDRLEGGEIANHFNSMGFKTLDLTDDELAKLHIRHMVGGRSALAQNEKIFQFEFPERPGALMKFLTELNPGWNISLFHYRNHGADYGKILVGIQLPESDNEALARFMESLGYKHSDETDNPVYKLFLNSV